jgi:hypothetical protein
MPIPPEAKAIVASTADTLTHHLNRLMRTSSDVAAAAAKALAKTKGPNDKPRQLVAEAMVSDTAFSRQAERTLPEFEAVLSALKRAAETDEMCIRTNRAFDAVRRTNPHANFRVAMVVKAQLLPIPVPMKDHDARPAAMQTSGIR